MSIGRERQPAVTLRNDEREEALSLEVLPDFGRQIGSAVRDIEVIEHATEPLAGSFQKRLLLGGERGWGGRGELAPVRLAGEQLSVPPYGAGLERLALGVRHG